MSGAVHRLAAALAVVAALPAFAANADGVAQFDIDVHVDPVENRITGSVDFSVTGGGAIHLRLDPGLAVTGATADGAPLSVERTGEDIAVPAGPGTRRSVHVAYSGRLTDRPLSAEGGMLEASANWYPALPEAALRHRIAVHTRAPFKGVSPGRLIDEKDTPSSYVATFESEAPGEPPTLFVGPYRIGERFAAGVRIRTYFPPALTPLSDGYLEDTARYVARYSESIGAYPFSGFSVVSGPAPVGLGFPGLTYMGQRVLKLPFIRKSSLGHEVLHCWWGNGVFIDTAEGNWAEGLTTFMADYAFAEDTGPQAARAMRDGWLRDYAALPPERDRAPRTFTSKGHDASQIVGYGKVAFFLYMLRDEIGAPAFADALRRFWSSHRFRPATWSDLRSAFEQASGRDLAAYFAQWLDRPGAPALRLVHPEVENGTLALTVRQDGKPYDLHLGVTVETDKGAKQYRVHVSDAETRLRLPLDGTPKGVTADPDSTLFRRLDPSETQPILRDITLAKDVLSVIAFAGEIEQKAAKLLIKAIMDQPPFFVPPYLSPAPTDPFVVIGPPAEVEAYLGGLDVLGSPDEIAGRGSARVWTGKRGKGSYLVITANTAADVTALLRPLPHYRRSSWLVFDGGKVVDKGIWPPSGGPLTVRLQ